MRNDGVSSSGGLNERKPGWCVDEKWCLMEWRLNEREPGWCVVEKWCLMEWRLNERPIYGVLMRKLNGV